MKTIKLLLFLMLMLLLWIPIIQQNTGFFDEPKLNGAFNDPAKPALSAEQLKAFQYQKGLEDYLNYKFGFRGLLVKIKNSLAYLLWKNIPVADNIEGKDGMIFSKGSISRSVGFEYNGKAKNEATAERIHFLQEGLEKQGARLLVVMAPSKESVMPDAIPVVYREQLRDNNDYADLIKAYKKYNIPYLDFCRYFRTMNDSSRFPLFTKTGFHWSMYGASLAQDSMLSYVSKEFGQAIPCYVREGIEWSDTARSSDNDFEEPMNLLFKLDKGRYVYPLLKMRESSRKNFRPKVIVIGDSFFLQLKRQNILKDIFSEDSKFWFYFATTSYSLDENGKNVPLSEVNIMEELRTADLVLLFASMGTLPTFPFGVTDYYYNNVADPSTVEGIVNYMRSGPERMKAIEKMAALQKKTPEQVLVSEAKKACRDKTFFRMKAANGKYICADAAQDDLVLANKDAASTWELFSAIRLDENNIVLSSFQNKFLSAEFNNKGRVAANRSGIGDWEVFTKIELGKGLVAFKASNGNYLSLDEKTSELFASTGSIGNRETFLWISQ